MNEAGSRPTAASPGHLALLTAPLPGHLNPLQVLAGALVERGWRVSVVHTAGTHRFLTDPRIGFAALPGDTAATLDTYLATLVTPTGPARLSGMIRATAGMTEQLLDHAPAVLERIGATAVLADAVEPAGPLIARRLALPHAVAVTGLPLMGEVGVPPPYLGWRYRPDPWGRFRNRAGYAVADWLMRPMTRVIETRRRAWCLEDGPAPRIQVAQCPRALDYPRRALPPDFHYGTPWRGVEPKDPHLSDDGGRPLIFCTLGTLQGSRRDLFAIMAQACAAIGARAVIAHGGGLSDADAAALPGQPLVRAFWPQTAVMRRCSAAVLHGGFNSVLDAFAAGLPMVVVPIGFEQPATAARVVRVGAGRMLFARRLTVRALVQALRAVLGQPAYRRAAGALAAEIAGGGGADEAAATITAALTFPA